MITYSVRCAALVVLLLGSSAQAQFQLPDLSGGSSSGTGGGLSGLLGAALPNVASVGANNAAGVLGYCLRNKYLGPNGAASILGQLTGRPGTKSSPGYAAGQKGLLQMNGSSLPLGNLQTEITTKVCDLVLKRAQALL